MMLDTHRLTSAKSPVCWRPGVLLAGPVTPLPGLVTMHREIAATIVDDAECNAVAVATLAVVQTDLLLAKLTAAV